MNKEVFATQLKEHYYTENEGQYWFTYSTGYGIEINVSEQKTTITLESKSVTIIPSRLIFMGKIEDFTGDTIEPYELGLSQLGNNDNYQSGKQLLYYSKEIFEKSKDVNDFNHFVDIIKATEQNFFTRDISRVIQLPNMLCKYKEDFVSAATLTVTFELYNQTRLNVVYACGVNYLEYRFDIDDTKGKITVPVILEMLSVYGTIVGQGGRRNNRIYRDEVCAVLAHACRKYFIDDIIEDLDKEGFA